MFIIQSEEKLRISIGRLTNVKIIVLIWNSKYKYTTWNFLFIHTYDYWNNKHGDVKENVSCASSGIHLLSIFETLSQKLEVLLSIFCGTKNFFNPPPPPIINIHTIPPFITEVVQMFELEIFLLTHHFMPKSAKFQNKGKKPPSEAFRFLHKFNLLYHLHLTRLKAHSKAWDNF